MTDASTRITLVRHGDVHNPENVVYGRLPGFKLSGVGRKQVKTAAEALNGTEISDLYSSPQLRAQETATIIQRHQPDLTVTTTPLLDEIASYFEGHTIEQLEARNWDLYSGVEEEGYETPEIIAGRIARFITNALERHTGEHIVAVSHGDIIAFGVLWAMHAAISVSLKGSLDRYGIVDRYPATASLTTLIYSSPDPAEIPELVYVRPYGEELVRKSLS